MKNVKNIIRRAAFLRYLSEYMPIPKIALRVKKSENSLYRLRDRMVRDGLLNSDYSITRAGFALLEKHSLLLQNVTRRNVTRLHNTAIVVGLAGKPSDWDERREAWQVSNQGRKWRLNSGMFNEVKVTDTLRVRTTPSSVILFFGDVYADDPVSTKNELFNLALPAILQAEEALKVRLHRHGTFIFRTAQQEFAFVKNRLAVELCKAGFKVRVEDMMGRTRVIVDESLGFGELETPNAIRGEADAVALRNHFEDVVVFGLSLRETNARLEAVEHALKTRPAHEEDRREIG